MKYLLGLLSVIFVGTLLLSFLLFFCVLGVFHEFDIVSTKVQIWASFAAAVVFSVVCLWVAIRNLKAGKKTKFENWLSNNSARIMLAYTLLYIFSISVRTEVFLSFAEMKEILTLGWTIFGISAAIFLLWSATALKYLEERKPIKPNSKFPTKTWLYIKEKETFYSDATFLLNNVNLLLANLLGLSIATVFIFVIHRKASVLSQSITIFVLLLCTNSIVGLFLDMLKPFNEKKKALLKETKVTSADIALQNEIGQQTELISTAIDAIESAEGIDEEKKTMLLQKTLGEYYEMFFPTEEADITKDE